MNKSRIFIIGIRRSGTSILRKLILFHSKVYEIKFEPHELIYCCRTQHIKRYKNSKYHKRVIEYYNKPINIYKGAKIALNVGIEAMNWRWLNRKFPKSKFIFIKRNVEDTYNSWIKQDKKSVRGICSYETYADWHSLINDSFYTFVKEHRNDSCIVYYENLIENTDKELEKVWNILQIKKIEGLGKQIHKPENWSVK